MYPNTVILEISRLLDEGQLSHRAVAAKIGVSRGLVDNIASGRRGLRRHSDPRSRFSREHALQSPSRCRRCGGLVHGACLLCHARDHQRKAFGSRLDASATPPRVA